MPVPSEPRLKWSDDRPRRPRFPVVCVARRAVNRNAAARRGTQGNHENWAIATGTRKTCVCGGIRAIVHGMKVATFNVNSIRSRMDTVIGWMKAHKPDILCLQETKVVDCEFPSMAFSELGYYVIFCGEKSYNGVAIATRAKPDTVSFGLGDGGAGSDPARLAYARIGDLHIVNTYVPQGRAITHAMYQYKQAWLRRLRTYFDRRFSPDEPVLWAGDLNVAREGIDVHNAAAQANHVCFHQDVRRVFEETLAWGFVDLCRERHPGERIYTFYDYRTVNAVDRKMGWRIDYLLATPPLARRLKTCDVDLEPRRQLKPSDHTFLVAEFAR